MITSFSPLLLPPWAEERVTDIQFYFVVLIDIFYYGCAFGARVQRVQKVQRVQRVAVAADAADYKKGARLRRRLCRRVVKGKVDGPPGRRLWPPVGGGLCIASLRGRRPFGPRGVDCPTGNEFYNAACGGHVSIEYLFSLLTSYTLSRYAGIRPGGKHVTGFAGRGAPL